jgi:PhzF family phenazine biosynthesis protein
MKIPLWQIDAFTNTLFKGNPAAVCLLESWLPDELLQKIAQENNLSETAFVVKTDGQFEIRWFSPVCEVDLCGHATLAASWVLFNELEYPEQLLRFDSRRGPLFITQTEGLLTMDFPAEPPEFCDVPKHLIDGLKQTPLVVLQATDIIAVFELEDQVRYMQPDPDFLKKIPGRGVCVTAPSKDCDFISRFFAPNFGIPEDPVTGSAHCELVPYWAKILKKNKLHARQVSPRGGELFCELKKDRVHLSGHATLFLRGDLFI